MGDPAVVFDHVWKKFNRAERLTSLRDLIPSMVKSAFRRKHPDELESQEFWAIRDVSFEVRPGEALGIIGPNGAGKSTIHKLLTKILKPTTGRCLVKGRIGALVEVAAGFHPDLTGRENIYLQGAIMGMRRAEIARKFDQIVEFSGVPDFIDTPIKRYSSGMNARLGFAVAAHLDPDVLLIDEVLAVGDIAFQERCYERMQRFTRSGAAVVFVSHNLSAIAGLCDRVLVLKRGSVQTLAPTDEAIASYAQMLQDTGADSASPEGILQLLDREQRPVTEVTAGDPLIVRARVFPPAAPRPLTAGLHIRHLESGEFVFHGQAKSAGCGPILVQPPEGVELQWSIAANLGRGHYSVSLTVGSAKNETIMRLAPVLLTVHERESERAVVYLEGTCSVQPIGTLSAAAPAEVSGVR